MIDQKAGVSLLVRIDRSCSNHSSETQGQAADGHDPGICDHQSVNEAGLDHLSRSETDDANTQAGV